MLEELILKEDRALFSNATAQMKPTAIYHLAAGLTTNQRHCYDSHVKKSHIYVCNAVCKYFYQPEQQTVSNARSDMPEFYWERLWGQACS